MDLFQTFDRILAGDSDPVESVNFTVRRRKRQLEVLVAPKLKDAPEKLDDADAQFRGALALPLRVCDDAATLDAQFFDQLTEYAQARADLAAECHALDELREAARQAKAATKRASQDARSKKANEQKSGSPRPSEASATATAAGGTAPPPADDAPAENPLSLF